MKNQTTVLFVFIAALAFVAFITNPPVEKHREEVKIKMNKLMQQSLYNNLADNSSGIESNLGAAFGSMLGSAILDPFIDAAIFTDNYIVFSTTKLTWNGETKTIGYGVFGTVILSNAIDNVLKQEIDNAISSNN